MQLAYSHNTTALNRPGTATAAASAQSSVGQQRWYPTGSVLLAHPSFSFVSPQPLFAANTRAQPNPAVAVVKVAILGRRHRCADQLPVSVSFSLSLSLNLTSRTLAHRAFAANNAGTMCPGNGPRATQYSAFACSSANERERHAGTERCYGQIHFQCRYDRYNIPNRRTDASLPFRVPCFGISPVTSTIRPCHKR